jgi:hypothetical protein
MIGLASRFSFMANNSTARCRLKTLGATFVFTTPSVSKVVLRCTTIIIKTSGCLVLDGEFLFQVVEDTFRLTKGDSILGPRTVPHAFASIGDFLR